MRWSAQVMAWPTGRCLASSSAKPCMWPSRPMASTSWTRALCSAARTAMTVFDHQAAGSCSARFGSGTSMGISREPTPRTVPASSMTTALTDEVPRSMPSSAAMG